MKLISTIKTYTSYGFTSTFQTANKIATDPGSFKKLGGIITEVIKAMDYKTGASHLPNLVQNLKGSSELIELWDGAKNVKYWAKPFETIGIDKEKLSLSLDSAIKTLPQKSIRTGKTAEELTKAAFDNSKNVKTQEEFFNSLERSLVESGYSYSQAGKIIENVQIVMKPRPIMEILIKISVTVGNLGANLNILDKWKVIDLAKMAGSVGTKAPVLKYVIAISLGNAISAAYGCAQVLGTLDSSYKIITSQREIFNAKKGESTDGAVKTRNRALWELANAGTDLAITVVNTCVLLNYSYFVALNPPVFIAMAICSKSIGLAKNLIYS
ncbi:MAG: hypothetical protein H0W88_07965 [Parachlamydiaceae bacterium]|nr:hypothetical protein [Parachlamydiaceae bacterium]